MALSIGDQSIDNFRPCKITGMVVILNQMRQVSWNACCRIPWTACHHISFGIICFQWSVGWLTLTVRSWMSIGCIYPIGWFASSSLAWFEFSNAPHKLRGLDPESICTGIPWSTLINSWMISLHLNCSNVPIIFWFHICLLLKMIHISFCVPVPLWNNLRLKKAN